MVNKNIKKLFSQLFPSLICQRTAPLYCDGENEYTSLLKKCQEFNRVFLFFFMNISTGDAQKKNAPVGKHTSLRARWVLWKNPAVFLRKILGFFLWLSAKAPSMQPRMLSHSAFFSVHLRLNKWIYIVVKIQELKNPGAEQKKAGTNIGSDTKNPLELWNTEQPKAAPSFRPLVPEFFCGSPWIFRDFFEYFYQKYS